MDKEQRSLAEELLFGEKKKPSFAKQFFAGLFDSKQLFPYPSLALEEEGPYAALLEEFNRFADREIDPVKIDREASIPDTVIDGLGHLGILGMTIPKQYSGLGMSQQSYCALTEQIARRCGSTALFVNAHQSVGLKALLLFGTNEQKERWLPRLARGEDIAAFSLTEPNAGSDASGIETRAILDESKGVYRINGKKQWTTNGSIAQVLTVMAKTAMKGPNGVEEKITAFLVTPDMPGFQVTAAALEKVGMRGTKTSNLEFRDMEVPIKNILGPLGGGLKVCLTVLDYGRTTFGATCTGAAKTLIERALEHAKTRIQFKKPLASFPLVKEKLANMHALTYAMEATTYVTAALADRQGEDFMLEAAMLKVFASDSLWSILYDTMQIFGGRSFFTDAPFERMMRDARLNMIGEGSNEVMRAFIGLVGMRDIGVSLQSYLEKMKHPIQNRNVLGLIFSEIIRRTKTPQVPVNSSLLKKEAKLLGRAIRRFGMAVLRTLVRYRESVIDQQLLLNRLATSAMAIYTTSAVLSKIDHSIQDAEGNSSLLESEVATAKYYCRLAFRQIERALHPLFDSYDLAVESTANQIIQDDYL